MVEEKVCVNVNYEMAKENHVRADAQKAIQIFLSGDEGTSLIIFPQALNPFLKALEGLGIWRQAVVIPYSDTNNKPVYIVFKVDAKHSVTDISLAEER